MKLILTWLPLMVLFTVQCSKQKNDIPACIQNKIDYIKSQPKWNPLAEVNEYIYMGKHAFLFSADCCDQYNELFDSNCNYICAPSGGITGKGDLKCTDFMTTAQFVRLVWKDSR